MVCLAPAGTVDVITTSLFNSISLAKLQPDYTPIKQQLIMRAYDLLPGSLV